MDSPQGYIQEYKSQLCKGLIQKAYQYLMKFMSDLSIYLKKRCPEITASSLYHGYMDMTYFAFTPDHLKCKKLKIAIVYLHEHTDLVQGNAETLPFRDEVFEVVFHIGGINFFNNKAKAIMEMIRVAKPGANIYIGDETVKQIEKQPKFISYFYQKPDPEIYAPPLKHIPKEMIDVVTHTLWNEMLYLVSFQKPK